MKGSKKKASKLVDQAPDELLKKIGARLKRLRKEKGYDNGDDFAYDKGINRSQYGKYEAGSQDMRISSLTRVINAFDMSIEEFFSSGLD